MTSASGNQQSSPLSLSEQVTSAALNYRANAPLIDNMLKEIGLVDKQTGSLEDLINGQYNLATQIFSGPTAKKDDLSIEPSVGNGLKDTPEVSETSVLKY